jgi:hypothetical protein
MLPSEVSVTRISDQTEFDKSGNPVQFRQYTFTIGNYGPFYEKFYAGEQDTPAIERRINNRVAELRALGVVKQT